ncbi:MAG: hypothetical protein AAF467_27705 [Actinomycetota bacterium]
MRDYLDEFTRARLRRASKRFGLPQTAIRHLGVTKYLDEIERTGQVVITAHPNQLDDDLDVEPGLFG